MWQNERVTPTAVLHRLPTFTTTTITDTPLQPLPDHHHHHLRRQYNHYLKYAVPSLSFLPYPPPPQVRRPLPPLLVVSLRGDLFFISLRILPSPPVHLISPSPPVYLPSSPFPTTLPPPLNGQAGTGSQELPCIGPPSSGSPPLFPSYISSPSVLLFPPVSPPFACLSSFSSVFYSVSSSPFFLSSTSFP